MPPMLTTLTSVLDRAKKPNSLLYPLYKKFRALRSRFIDSHTHPYTKTFTEPALTKVARTYRYKALRYGLAVTRNERNILKYRNSCTGRRAFVIGNGPSLNKLDLSLMKDDVTIGVNSIFLAYEKMGFLPTHYVVEDIFVAEDRAKEIAELKGPQKWFGNYLRYALKDNSDANWLNVRCRYDNYPNFPYFSKDAGRMVWTGGSVTYICMQLAYYLGVRELYLIGFDHSYEIPKDATVEGLNITSQSDDPNHFHPDYFGKGYRWHDPKVDRMEQAYRRARLAFESDGRKIMNATAGGRLEVFERVDYNSLFGKR